MTAKTKIGVQHEKLSMEIDKDMETFNILQAMIHKEKKHYVFSH